MRRPASLSGCLLALLLAGTAAAAEGDAPPGDPRSEVTAGGRLIVDADDELDLLGDLWADLPIRLRGRHRLTFGVETRTSIERAGSDLAFLVRDLDYHLEAGWRRGRLSAYLGQRGKQRVDDDGQPYLRYAGVAFESRNYRTHAPDRFGADGSLRSALAWRVAGGPVFDEREVSGDVVLRGDARILPWRLGAGRLGFDLGVDGFFDGSRFRADVAAGPRLDLPMGGVRAVSLFARYQRSRNPLGIDHSALLAGFALTEGTGDAPASVPGRGDRAGSGIDGQVGVGTGERGRHAAQLKLRFLSSPVLAGWQAVLVVDANVLTASDTGDLYYFYHLGGERRLGRSRGGIYFYHRSNHAFAEPNDTVTSLNVLEAGLETADWHRPGRRDRRGRWGRLDARARLGYLIESDFGEDRRWHARGGLRWTLPGPGPLGPYLLAEAEAGDVERRLWAVGFSPARRLDVQLELRDDEQSFSRERRVALLVARYGF